MYYCKGIFLLVIAMMGGTFPWFLIVSVMFVDDVQCLAFNITWLILEAFMVFLWCLISVYAVVIVNCQANILEHWKHHVLKMGRCTKMGGFDIHDRIYIQRLNYSSGSCRIVDGLTFRILISFPSRFWDLAKFFLAIALIATTSFGLWKR